MPVTTAVLFRSLGEIKFRVGNRIHAFVSMDADRPGQMYCKPRQMRQNPAHPNDGARDRTRGTEQPT